MATIYDESSFKVLRGLEPVGIHAEEGIKAKGRNVNAAQAGLFWEGEA